MHSSLTPDNCCQLQSKAKHRPWSAGARKNAATGTSASTIARARRSPFDLNVSEAFVKVTEFAQGASSGAATALQNFVFEHPEGSSILGLKPNVRDVKDALSKKFNTFTARRKGPSRDQAELLKQKEAAALRLVQQQARNNAAVKLLQKRAQDGSQPGSRRDPFKLGLVVEGGGMRGAVSGGALQALHDLGVRDCFDAVYGSSAGAINATYFLAGQREGVNIYSQDITTPEFIDLRRLLRQRNGSAGKRPALDLSFLLDNIMNNVKPLDWEAVVNSAIPLKIVASCLETLQPVLLENFADVHDLRECLRASATVPEVAGEPVCHRGKRLVDAAVFEAIPFRAAIADGCTHVIALPTRPPFREGDFIGRLIDDSVATVVKKAVMNPAYMKAAWIKEVQYQKAFGCSAEELLVRGLTPDSHQLPAMAGCHVFPVFPGPAASYSPMCIDAATIMLGIAEGRSAVLNSIGSILPNSWNSHAVTKRDHRVKESTSLTPVIARSVNSR